MYIRWILLLFYVQVMMGGSYCFDVPASLYKTLRAHFSDTIDENLFPIYFSGLYTFYSIANTFLPLITGQMLDKFGSSKILCMGCILMILGQFLFIQGVFMKNWIVMYIGRILLGWGQETQYFTISIIFSDLFSIDHFGLGLGVNHLFISIGAISTMYINSRANQMYGLQFTLNIGLYFLLFGFCCALIASIINYYHPFNQSQYQLLNIEQDDKVQKQKNTLYWLLGFFQAIVAVSIVTFAGISVGFLEWHSQGQIQEQQAGQMMAIMWLVCGLSAPLLGLFNDSYGQRSNTVIVCSIFCALSHLLILYYNPMIFLVILGLTYSMTLQGAWAGTIYILDEQQGKSYAIFVCMFNIGLSIIPFIIGFLISQLFIYRVSYYKTFFYSQIVLIIMGFSSFIIGCFIKKYDSQLNQILDGYKAQLSHHDISIL